MFVRYTNNGNTIVMDVGSIHSGKLISAGDNRLPITTVNKDGCVEMAHNVFRKFKKEMYMGEEQLIFEKRNNELV